MIFINARAADAATIVALVNTAYRAPGAAPGWTDERELLAGPRITEQSVLHAIEVDRVLLLEAPSDTIVACARISPQTADMWSVSMIAVDPARQGDGLGRALLHEIERQARDSGIHRVKLSVIRQRDALISWYERRGYIRTGAIEPFPYGNAEIGRPLRDDLALAILEKPI